MDEDGRVTTAATMDDGKDTAQSHTPRTPPLAAALGDFNDPAAGNQADDDAGLDLTLLKKKKKKKAVKAEDEDGAEGGGDEAAAGEEPAIDLGMKKKKKKKVVKEGEDEFVAKLKALELDGGAAAGEGVEDGGEGAGDEDEVEAPTAAPTSSKAAAADGDMDKGTGIWAHDETKAVPFALLMDRFFGQLALKNPDHASSGSRTYKIPPPQCLREGNKKTIFANIQEICKRMKRTEEHVTAYLFAELGTSGSVDGSRRLVIKGRFQQKQIENVLRKYIGEWSRLGCCLLREDELLTMNSRVCHLQDVQIPRHGAQQGREPAVLYHLQLVRFAPVRYGHQDWFLGPSRQEKEDAGLNATVGGSALP